MKVVVIGGTGHIGTYLVPRLLEAGHDVVCVTRGKGQPYRDSGLWRFVTRVEADRDQEEAAGSFGRRVASLAADAVIDLICFKPESAQALMQSLRGKTGHLLTCGTIWVHGHSSVVPTTEDATREPFGDYGIQKARMEALLLAAARTEAFPVTVLHPGHIVGQGWAPLNPAGNFNPAVFETLAKGEELALPNLGMETVHHVHADDVAQAFCLALANRSVSIGESFHVVAASALTLRGYAEKMARWFGREARLSFQPWEEWRGHVSEDDARATWDHIAHSPHCSIDKARRLLGYEPCYSPLQAVQESVEWLINHGKIQVR